MNYSKILKMLDWCAKIINEKNVFQRHLNNLDLLTKLTHNLSNENKIILKWQ